MAASKEWDVIVHKANGAIEVFNFNHRSIALRFGQAIWKDRHTFKVRQIHVIHGSRPANVIYSQPDENPPRDLVIFNGQNKKFFLGIAEGDKIVKIVAGPFRSKLEAYAVRRAWQRKHARSKGASENPKRTRMGKLVEIRYERDHGRHKGYYKHTFESDVDVYADDHSIFARSR